MFVRETDAKTFACHRGKDRTNVRIEMRVATWQQISSRVFMHLYVLVRIQHVWACLFPFFPQERAKLFSCGSKWLVPVIAHPTHYEAFWGLYVFSVNRVVCTYLGMSQWIPEPGSCWPPAECPAQWEPRQCKRHPSCPSPPTWPGPSLPPSYCRERNESKSPLFS